VDASEAKRIIARFLDLIREPVMQGLEDAIPDAGPYASELYEPMLRYPRRRAKLLRPALCIAAAMATGGMLEQALPTAVAIELYHNAFLIHDDVEDRSLQRRGGDTLYRELGMSAAMNVGDGMLALALGPLLENTKVLGLGPALRVLEAMREMAVETAEGQALELDWIRRGVWQLADDDYITMVHKKTGHYTFINPVRLGGLIGGAEPSAAHALDAYATKCGIAFQIADDLLNLQGAEATTGKEWAGDLAEGKRTLILLHALRAATAHERATALEILARPRPEEPSANLLRQRAALARLRAMHDEGRLQAEELSDLEALLATEEEEGQPDRPKSPEDVAFLFELVRRRGSMEHARRIAVEYSRRARARLEEAALPAGQPHEFLEAVAVYAVQRNV